MRFPAHLHKIRPFGLFFPVQSIHQHSEIRRAVMAELTSGEPFRRPAQSLSRLRARVRAVREDRRRKQAGNDWSRNDRREFEAPASAPARRQILFLTRAFDPGAGWNAEDADYVMDLNEQRAGIIRAMRRHFGERFIGGLMKDAHSTACYPDCLATVSTLRSDYLKLLRERRVAISTTGLRDSIPAKIAEYIAASRCLMTEPLRYELPYAIEHRRHAMVFDSVDQCIQSGEELLTDDGLAAWMREENERLYRSCIEPSAGVWRCMKQAFETPGVADPRSAVGDQAA